MYPLLIPYSNDEDLIYYFILGEKIGEKSRYGTIYESYYKKDMVIKKVLIKSKKEYKNFCKEVQFQRKVENNKISPTIYGLLLEDNYGYILMEKCNGYTIKKILKDCLESTSNDKEKTEMILNLSENVIQKLITLVSLKISHGDCHVDNIIVDMSLWDGNSTFFNYKNQKLKRIII